MDIRSYIPLTSPYFYQGTGGPWDEDRLLKAFATASLVEVASENRYMASPWFGLNVGGGPSSVAMMSAPTYPVVHDVATLKVTKVGQLQRKEEQLEGGRKANGRKWKDWSVLLTGSQLLFSRDPNWATMIQTRAHVINANGSSSLPQALLPRPDEMMSLRDAIAVYDRSYTKVCPSFILSFRTWRTDVIYSTPIPLGWPYQMVAIFSFRRKMSKI